MKAWLTQGRRGRREDYEKHHCSDLAGPEREYNPQITSIDPDWGRQGRRWIITDVFRQGGRQDIFDRIDTIDRMGG